MKYKENTYYHFYNRTNNEEALFRSEENYIYFLKKYRYYFDEFVDTIAYCLMPTHFHFLIKTKSLEEIGYLESVEQMNIKSKDVRHLGGVRHLADDLFSKQMSKSIQQLQSSYTKAINKAFNRHGSLFQQRAKPKEVTNENYFLKLIFYIHQNPSRSDLVEDDEDWLFSSYRDYIDIRNGNLPKMDYVKSRYSNKEIIEKNKQTIYLEQMSDTLKVSDIF